MTSFATARGRCRVAVAGLALGCGTATPLRAEITLTDLARKIDALQAENRAMRHEISELKEKNRKTASKVRSIAARPVAPPPPVAMTMPPSAPAGSTPVLATPDKAMQIGAITITPGGFFAAESVFRSRTTQSDLLSEFRAVPFRNNPLAGVNEFRPSARATRFELLAEAAITPTFLASGFIDIDFLGAGQTANAFLVSGYQPRIRNAYAALDDQRYGVHLLAGQNWSLMTLNSKGITPRNEVIPPTIDGQFVAGMTWTRQPQIRLTKDFDRKLWISLSAEASQTILASPCTTAGAAGGLTPAGANAGIAGVSNITCAGAGTGGSFSNLTNYTLNHVPDVIGKVAYEARLADRDVHLEALGIYRNFYDRVAYTDGRIANQDTTGYGAGAGLVVPLVPRRVDLQLSGVYGRGIGRYGSSQLADATFGADGSLRPLRQVSALAGVTMRATPSIDLYAYAGIEKIFPSYFQNPDGSFVGVGSPALAAANAGCNIEGSALCSSGFGNTSQIWQLAGGMWDKIYKGSFGEVRGGVQYSYTKRAIFNAPGLPNPQTDNHTVFTSLRYYPFK